MRLLLVAGALLFVADPGRAGFVVTTIGVADTRQRLGAGDLDGDGGIDFAVACAGAGHVALLFNDTL